MIREAIDRSRAAGCHLVQLTSDKQRPDALRFYAALGFVASHEGFKLRLDGSVGRNRSVSKVGAGPSSG